MNALATNVLPNNIIHSEKILNKRLEKLKEKLRGNTSLETKLLNDYLLAKSLSNSKVVSHVKEFIQPARDLQNEQDIRYAYFETELIGIKRDITTPIFYDVNMYYALNNPGVVNSFLIPLCDVLDNKKLPNWLEDNYKNIFIFVKQDILSIDNYDKYLLDNDAIIEIYQYDTEHKTFYFNSNTYYGNIVNLCHIDFNKLKQMVYRESMILQFLCK
jgi:hypothetical protein